LNTGEWESPAREKAISEGQIKAVFEITLLISNEIFD